MLDLALKSKIPLIAVNTTDTIYCAETLSYLANIDSFVYVESQHINRVTQSKFMTGHSYFYCFYQDGINWAQMYGDLQELERVLVVLNPEEIDLSMYNAGALALPKQVLLEHLSTFVSEDIEIIAQALSGLTLKEVYELCRMCQIFDASISVPGIIAIRKKYMSGRYKGLVPVDTNISYYFPNDDLINWLSIEGKLLTQENVPEVLIPRGLLFTGSPGTGKTLGAKFIAHSLQIPLYRLDLASMLDKYQGVAENRLESILGALDTIDPCICLIDEVEKLFSGNDNIGTTQKLLSMLLWWMQERTSKVLVIMTTNNHTTLPKELYRPGRINATIEFQNMCGESQIREFIEGIMTSLAEQMEVPTLELDIDFNSEYSQAELTEMVYSEIKKTLIQ